MGCLSGNRLFPGYHIEEEWSGSSFKPHPTIYTDKVETLWGSAISVVGGVIHLLKQGRNGDVQPEGAGIGDLFPFTQACMLPVKHPVVDVSLALPAVGRVCLPEIDNKEGYPISEPFVDIVQAARLGSERGSGVASKDKSHWPLPSELGQSHSFLSPQPIEAKVRSLLILYWTHCLLTDQVFNCELEPVRAAS